MQAPTFILYVASPTASAAFYTDLLGQPPVEASPGFALFALSSGVTLGLWAAHAVEAATTPAGGLKPADLPPTGVKRGPWMPICPASRVHQDPRT